MDWWEVHEGWDDVVVASVVCMPRESQGAFACIQHVVLENRSDSCLAHVWAYCFFCTCLVCASRTREGNAFDGGHGLLNWCIMVKERTWRRGQRGEVPG